MKLLNAIMPVLAADKANRPRGVGTGFLLSVSNRNLLVTAAHVVDEHSLGPLYLPSKRSGLIELPKEAIVTSPPDARRELDKIDLAFWDLPSDAIGRLDEERWFIPSQFIRCREPAGEDFTYTFFGYPHKKVNTVYGKSSFTVRPESFTGKCVCGSIVEDIGGRVSDNFGIEFNSKRAVSNGEIVTPSDRRGMSGGPVVAYTDGRDFPALPPLRIIGVAIEHHPKSKAVLCTRIDALIGMVQQHFQVSDLPTSSATILTEAMAKIAIRERKVERFRRPGNEPHSD